MELKQPLLLERGRILISAADLVTLLQQTAKGKVKRIMLKTDSVHLTLQVGKDLAVVTRGEILEIAGLDVPPRDWCRTCCTCPPALYRRTLRSGSGLGQGMRLCAA